MSTTTSSSSPTTSNVSLNRGTFSGVGDAESVNADAAPLFQKKALGSTLFPSRPACFPRRGRRAIRNFRTFARPETRRVQKRPKMAPVEPIIEDCLTDDDLMKNGASSIVPCRISPSSRNQKAMSSGNSFPLKVQFEIPIAKPIHETTQSRREKIGTKAKPVTQNTHFSSVSPMYSSARTQKIGRSRSTPRHLNRNPIRTGTCVDASSPCPPFLSPRGRGQGPNTRQSPSTQTRAFGSSRVRKKLWKGTSRGKGKCVERVRPARPNWRGRVVLPSRFKQHGCGLGSTGNGIRLRDERAAAAATRRKLVIRGSASLKSPSLRNRLLAETVKPKNRRKKESLKSGASSIEEAHSSSPLSRLRSRLRTGRCMSHNRRKDPNFILDTMLETGVPDCLNTDSVRRYRPQSRDIGGFWVRTGSGTVKDAERRGQRRGRHGGGWDIAGSVIGRRAVRNLTPYFNRRAVVVSEFFDPVRCF